MDKLLKIVPTTKFKKDMKRISKQQKNRALLDDIVYMLQRKQALPPKNRDHALTGNWNGFRECHITPDWLLIYRVLDSLSVELLEMVRTGSHSDLFS